MDGIVVLDLVLGVVALVTIIVRIGVRRLGRACRVVVGAPVPSPRREVVVPSGEDLEAVLAARVVHGQLSRGFYQQRMAALAADEDGRRPLSVPRT